MISPGSMRATAAASAVRSHSATVNSLVEMSIQASAKRSSVAEVRERAIASRKLLRLASSSESSVSVPERDQPHHVAPHHAFGAALSRLRRIFELLADRDPVAVRDQAVQIFVGALDRHAAHRNVAAEMLAALGQHDAEVAGRDFGIVEEQFVEIAHPVEQQAIRIGRLDLDILLHHRSYATRRRLGDGPRRRFGHIPFRLMSFGYGHSVLV